MPATASTVTCELCGKAIQTPHPLELTLRRKGGTEPPLTQIVVLCSTQCQDEVKARFLAAVRERCPSAKVIEGEREIG